jgi:CRP-like cAMP-binding protein
MAAEEMKRILLDEPFFQDIAPELLGEFTSCASLTRFEPGQMILREGEPADRFYVIRRGRIALSIQSPGRGTLVIQTLGDSDVLGWSWLIPPHQWRFDARALEPTETILIDTRCLMGVCATNHELGHLLAMKFAAIIAQRLQATRMQLLDLYAAPGGQGK